MDQRILERFDGHIAQILLRKRVQQRATAGRIIAVRERHGQLIVVATAFAERIQQICIIIC